MIDSYFSYTMTCGGNCWGTRTPPPKKIGEGQMAGIGSLALPTQSLIEWIIVGENGTPER